MPSYLLICNATLSLPLPPPLRPALPDPPAKREAPSTRRQSLASALYSPHSASDATQTHSLQHIRHIRLFLSLLEGAKGLAEG